MHRKKIKEVIHQERTVELYRYLHEVVTEDGAKLIMTQKMPLKEKPVGTVMLVHGLGQNRYTWNLSKRSLENYLVANGFETFNVELRGHGLSRANEGEYPKRFNTYIRHDLPAYIRAIREISEGRKIFYMGHSLGATIAYCIGAEFQDDLAGIVSIGGPFNMARGNLLLKTIARAGVMIERIVPFRLPYPEAFYIDYIGAIAKSGLFLMDNRFYRIPLQVWYPGSMERDVLEERISKGFDRTGMNIVRFMFKWGSQGKFRGLYGDTDYEKEITRLKAPVLFVVGDKDHAVPLEAIQKAYDTAGSSDKTLKIFDKKGTGVHWGHIDLIAGRSAPRHVWPYMLRWLKRRVG